MPSGKVITHPLEVDAATRRSIGIIGFERGLSSGAVVRNLVSDWRKRHEPPPVVPAGAPQMTLRLRLAREDVEWLQAAADSSGRSTGEVVAEIVRLSLAG